MNLQELLESTGYSTRSYSGRGMYGKNCLGVTLERGQTVMACVASVLEELATLDSDDSADALEELAKGLRRSCTDSMGLGTILYFPGIPFEGDEKDDEDDK